MEIQNSDASPRLISRKRVGGVFWEVHLPYPRHSYELIITEHHGPGKYRIEELRQNVIYMYSIRGWEEFNRELLAQWQLIASPNSPLDRLPKKIQDLADEVEKDAIKTGTMKKLQEYDEEWNF